jgi:hypothetical protein
MLCHVFSQNVALNGLLAKNLASVFKVVLSMKIFINHLYCFRDNVTLNTDISVID